MTLLPLEVSVTGLGKYGKCELLFEGSMPRAPETENCKIKG